MLYTSGGQIECRDTRVCCQNISGFAQKKFKISEKPVFIKFLNFELIKDHEF